MRRIISGSTGPIFTLLFAPEWRCYSVERPVLPGCELSVKRSEALHQFGLDEFQLVVVDDDVDHRVDDGVVAVA